MDDERLLSISTLSNLKPALRQSLLDNGKRSVMAKGTVVETYGERNWFLHLVDGEIKFYPAQGKAFTFSDTDQRALQPVFAEARGNDSIKFLKDSLVLRIDRKQLEQAEQASEEKLAVHDVEINEVGAGVLRQLFEDFHNGAISVPAMPAIAVRVRSLLEDEDSAIKDLAQLIEQDPALAGKLVAAANSALIGGRTEICSAEEALVRMGMARAASVVMTLAVQQMFTFRSRPLYAAGSRVWATATQVAATCRLLAHHATGNAVDQDKAFMIGLLHNVGAVAVLSYMEELDLELSAAAIDQTLNNLRAVSTTLVLNKWHMDGDFHVAGEDAEEEETRANPYYCLLEMAIAQVLIANGHPPETPITQLPGLRMLGDKQQIDDQGRLIILRDQPELAALPKAPGIENAA